MIATLAAHESNVAHALRSHFDQTEALPLSPRTPFNELQIKRVAQGAIFGGASTEAGTSRPGGTTDDARHVDVSADFSPWPLARHFIETLARRVHARDDEACSALPRRARG